MFKALLLCLFLTACGGDSGPTAPPANPGVRLTDFVLTPANPVHAVDTDGGPSAVFRVEFDWQPVGYLAANPFPAHMAVITRGDSSQLNAAGKPSIWGQGLACGILFYGPEPKCLLESWDGDKLPEPNWLYEPSLSPVLSDGTVYHVRFWGTVGAGGTRLMRYTIVPYDPVNGRAQPVYDSGDVLDTNTAHTGTQMAFGIAFSSGGGEQRFTNVYYWWDK